jgi:acyl-[acyl-carrier-protein]-phospholipid O-acyltransferase/long-chain-fatty-acid--[acyl-carrier-protein] ligase
MDTSDWKVQQGNIPGTVGLPVPGTSVRIVDPVSLEPVTLGEDGLILVAGSQVMSGYLGDELASAGAILEMDGMRWFCSGDRGHLTEEGFLVIAV